MFLQGVKFNSPDDLSLPFKNLDTWPIRKYIGLQLWVLYDKTHYSKRGGTQYS